MWLLQDVSACTLCTKHLPLWPRPIVRLNQKSKIIIIWQAPGTKVHASGKPRADASGTQLKKWLNIADEQFDDPDNFGIMPMWFCYPGKQWWWDAPPRPECAPQWHDKLLEYMVDHKLILLVGMYAQKYYLGKEMKKTLTETVRHFDDYLHTYFPIPHPSWRSSTWMKKNPWFEQDVLPVLQKKIQGMINV